MPNDKQLTDAMVSVLKSNFNGELDNYSESEIIRAAEKILKDYAKQENK